MLRLTTGRTEPLTCKSASDFRFRLLFIPLLCVPTPVFIASFTFTNNVDASAVSCVVTKFSTCPTVDCFLSPG